MGKYSSDDEERQRRTKKKKRRRSRSSSISSEHSHISNSKSKKLKRRQRRSSRSRSRSQDRKGSRASRRSRSSSASRYSSRKTRSDSRSSDRRSFRRSRSPPPKRGRSRSRSPSSRRPRSYSRSASRERRRNSRSYSRDRSNGERTSSRRSSADRRKGTNKIQDSPKLKMLAISESASGFSELTQYEQAEERMRLALKAAAAAGEKLKGHVAVEPADSKNFATSLASIESDSFVATSFRSSRTAKVKEEVNESGANHEDAIFGSLAISGFTLTPDLDMKPIQLDSDSIMHPSLYCDPQEKMEKWILRLSQLRRRKLEGDVIM